MTYYANSLKAVRSKVGLALFIQYSKVVESIVVASPINQSDKAIILSEMATARYGCKYWSIELL